MKMPMATLFLCLSSLLWASKAQTNVQRHLVFQPGGGVCNRNCPKNYEPVCGTNGQTYQNFCLLLVARRCDNIRVRKRHDGECGSTNPNCRPSTFCPFNYVPICGSDGKTYANECAFRNAACNDPRLTKVSNGECGSGTNCPDICPAVFSPVCGSDGKTYENECRLNAAACRNPSLKKAANGECGSRPNCPDVCPANYDPVCGTDGITYGNQCNLGVASCNNPSIKKAYNGECRPGPNCDFGCGAVYDPVCGTDGKTYSNQCTLDLAACKNPSIKKAHNGECGSVRPPIVVCPQGCPFNYSPVCGSDGITYPNQCTLESASCNNPSIRKLYDGECRRQG